MIRKFFELWPRSILFWIILSAIVAVGGVLDATVIFGIEWTGERFPPELWDTIQGFRAIVAMVIVATGGFLYGMHRITSVHPVFNKAYLDWLLCTPYDSEYLLPIGGVRVSPWDLTFLAPLSLFTILTPFFPWYAAIAFAVGGYLSAATYTLFISGLKRAAFCVGAGLALTIAMIQNPMMATVILLLLLLSSSWSIRESLSRSRMLAATESPIYREVGRQITGNSGTSLTVTEPPSVFAGAPVTSLIVASSSEPEPGDTSPDRRVNIGMPLWITGPYAGGPGLSVMDAFAISCVAGFWTLGVFVHIPWTGDRAESSLAAAVLSCVFLYALIFQLLYFLLFTRPPISLLGRIATRRFVIPGFDQVFLRILLVLVPPWALMSAFYLAGIPTVYGLGLSASVGLFILVAGPPSYKKWILLGHYRISMISNPGFESESVSP